ncbi:MAG: hypothetical protein IJM14_03125 [Lachnospiraceae bacterium]|nr:hypothetical protein [Lachnospiraceae bacterium]
MFEKIRTSVYIANTEFKRWIRSSKLIIVPLLLIAIRNLVAEPLIEASVETGYSLSFFEPFIALTNSGFVLLLMPLCFLVLMADFPHKALIDDLYHIRSSKRVWMSGQLLFAVLADMAFVLFMFLSSIVMVIGHADFKFDYSKGITHYTAIFPDRYGGLIGELVPRNLFNQMTMGESIIMTALFLFAYLLLMVLLLLFFTILGYRKLGVLTDVLLILGGTVTCAAKSEYQWLFPMAHTIPWIHFSEYLRKMKYPLWKSEIYLFGGCLMMIVLCIVFARKYEMINQE